MRPSHLGQSITAVAALAYLDMLAHICQPLLGTALVRLALYRNPYVMTRDSTYKHRLNKALPRLGTMPNQARKCGRGNPFAGFVSSGVETTHSSPRRLPGKDGRKREPMSMLPFSFAPYRSCLMVTWLLSQYHHCLLHRGSFTADAA